MKSFMRYALAKITVGMNPFDGAWLLLSATLSTQEADMLKAVVNRYQHEIQFRSYQNKIGAQFASDKYDRWDHYGVSPQEADPNGRPRAPREQINTPAKNSSNHDGSAL